MKKTIVFLLSLAFLINGMAQVSPSKPSEFGHCFMPYKDLRVLVVFVNIDNFDTIDDNNWSK